MKSEWSTTLTQAPSPGAVQAHDLLDSWFAPATVDTAIVTILALFMAALLVFALRRFGVHPEAGREHYFKQYEDARDAYEQDRGRLELARERAAQLEFQVRALEAELDRRFPGRENVRQSNGRAESAAGVSDIGLPSGCHTARDEAGVLARRDFPLLLLLLGLPHVPSWLTLLVRAACKRLGVEA